MGICKASVTKGSIIKTTDITGLIPEIMPENFCISPFQNAKYSEIGLVAPCPYASGSWDFKGKTPEEKWNADEVNERRMQSINNEKPKGPCERCWNEEAAGKDSLRIRQYRDYYPNDYETVLRSGQWVNGPRNVSFKVSNICNLACRTCTAIDSNSFNKEGEFYRTEYKSTNPVFNHYFQHHPPGHLNFKDYTSIANNIVDIEFYGGEPFLNYTHLDLLQHIIDRGDSKDVTLYYSTNCTIKLSDKILSLWDNFKLIKFGISIDGVGIQAEYMRWPCVWSEVQRNIDTILALQQRNTFNVDIKGSYTLSTLNITEVDNMMKWYNSIGVNNIFTHIVNSPQHLTIRLLPDYVKQELLSRIEFDQARNYMSVDQYSPIWWKRFIIWTKRMDLYRHQDFTKVFPDMYNIIKQDWDKVTDLSENNFHSKEL
jgi:sulfatase maturation enzyme AslB (radical SAM superfamily)